MVIKQLRKAITPCCGLGANCEDIESALASVESLLEAREMLLVETLNILEHSLKAMQMSAVTPTVIENHVAAITTIRLHFEMVRS